MYQSVDEFLALFETKDIKFDRRQLTRYVHFIESCKVRTRNGYTEIHHILPQSLFTEFRDEDWNKLRVSAREHFIAHWILAKAVGGNQWFGAAMMVSANNPRQDRIGIRITARMFEVLRIKTAEAASKNIRASRANESTEKRRSRVDKWRYSYYSKSEDKRQLSRLKQAESKKLNLKIRELGNERSCIVCRRVLKREYHRCKLPEVTPKVSGCCVRCRQIFQKPKAFIKHIERCAYTPKAPKRPKTIIVKPPKTRFQCERCQKRFEKESAYRRHAELGNCMLSKAERIELRNERWRATMSSKTAQEKTEMGRKISTKVKAFQQNMPKERRDEILRKLAERGLKYYQSDRYDPEVRSKQIKEGIARAKDSED
jgi:hypothetical protein